MDRKLRNDLRLAVVRCRTELTDDYVRQLEGTFGIYADGRIADEVTLPQLDAGGFRDRRAIVAALAHLTASDMSLAGAIAQFVRESAFSTLNRLTAIKLMEAPERKLVQESVGSGANSRGFRQFQMISPEAVRAEADGGYRLYLNLLCGDIAQEIGVLFDLRAPQGILFPGERALRSVLDQLNAPELATIWAEDETLGWVYQYFTPKELRDVARKESAAPRNADELAFRNQFYTPRYVVEFLTENTLGRTWYEMRQGKTALADRARCRYLVIWPDEVFLSSTKMWGKENADAAFLSGSAESIEPFRLPKPVQRGGEAIGDRVFTMPWSDLGREGDRLIRFAHFARPFDWMKDPRNKYWKALLERLETGDPDEPLSDRTQDLWDVLFALARAERFADGTVAEHAVGMTTIANEIRLRLLVTRNPDASTEDRLRATYLVQFRPKKDPRELRVLDPACGSGHFLLYAFELLLTIYQEAWDDPDSPVFAETGKTLRGDYPEASRFVLAVPGLILRHNLHGIDIDLRAVQIAQLALWLRAQRAYAELGAHPSRRPQVRRVNVVAAEPLPGERDLQASFVESFESPVIAGLVEEIWQGMAGVGEIGSLFKAEDLVRQAVADAKHNWQSGKAFDQITLFSSDAPPRQERLDLAFISDEAFWRDAGAQVMSALRDYANAASLGDRYRRRLFADDAAQGFAFLDLFDEPFDVVLMNPPFGAVSRGARAYVERHYPKTKNDLYAAFVERGLEVLRPRGYLGAITSRTGFFLTSFQKWREEIILAQTRIHAVADLGQGVLDTAMVETAAYTLERAK